MGGVNGRCEWEVAVLGLGVKRFSVFAPGALPWQDADAQAAGIIELRVGAN